MPFVHVLKTILCFRVAVRLEMRNKDLYTAILFANIENILDEVFHVYLIHTCVSPSGFMVMFSAHLTMFYVLFLHWWSLYWLYFNFLFIKVHNNHAYNVWMQLN